MRCALVLGLGVSGKAAAGLLLRSGYRVIGADDKVKPELLQEIGVESLTQDCDWSKISLCVVSPGVSPQHPLYRKALELGIEVIGEVELALRQAQLKKVVAITGTNGKTTVTLLVEHVLKSAGIKAKALGNVGSSLAAYVCGDSVEDVIVVELSSYQLETMSSAVFDGAVLLNIKPDHLDRYASMREYAQAKCHLQDLVKPDAPFLVNQQVVDDFSDLLKPGYQILGDIETILPLRYTEKGKHEIENAMAAWSLCRLFNVTQEQFCSGLQTFVKPHHRIEFVANVNGVDFYDDSKGTNIDAVIRAVDTMKGPVILIAGGVDKGASYLLWKEAFCGKVKRIVTIGQAASKIYAELSSFFEMEIVDSLEAAVDRSIGCAVQGDCVLLSPGCASFDMFRDYVHRGEEFQRVVYTHRDSFFGSLAKPGVTDFASMKRAVSEGDMADGVGKVGMSGEAKTQK